MELFLPDLSRLKNLGVAIKIMVTDGVDEKFLETLSKLVEVRVKERMFGGGIIIRPWKSDALSEWRQRL